MSNSNEKIGLLIQQIRQERGLTQAEFASKLRTSQSAVNRIEKGKQNLSLETLRLKPYGQPAASFLPHLQTRENEACVQWGN
jgi:DNA-binding XRE family transcriptional regulator